MHVFSLLDRVNIKNCNWIIQVNNVNLQKASGTWKHFYAVCDNRFKNRDYKIGINAFYL